MNVLRRAASAAMLIAATLIVTGCGDVFRPVATPLPTSSGNPSGTETEAVLNQCPTDPVGNLLYGPCQNPTTGIASFSVITAIDVSGDKNVGNKQLQNQVASVQGPVTVPGSLATPIAFDATRTSVFTANSATNSTGADIGTDTVSQLLLATSTAGFAANTTTLTLPPGSLPTGISFQYFGIPYTQDYVVNKGTTTVNCPGTGSLGVISQAATPATLKSVVCIGTFASNGALTTAANPVDAWIYSPDQSKVFVLDDQPASNGNVYVVNARKEQVTNHFAVGSHPFKVAQSNNGLFIYVLNGDHTISIIDGQAETVVATISTDNIATMAAPVDIAQDPNFNDTSANTQINHIWVLHADGTVSVWDGTTPGQLSWITSIATGGTPTNLALLRDGTWAYVGLAGTDQIVGIDTSKLSRGVVTLGATTSVTVGVHRNVSETLTNDITPASPISANVLVETTTPTVTSVAVSRQGNSAELSKVYATTATSTTYYCYDENVVPTDCANSDSWVDGTPISALPAAVPFLAPGCTNLNAPVEQNAMSCPNLYNGTSVVSAAEIDLAPGVVVPVNTLITTIPAPSVVTYCDPGNPATGEYDGQKNCPAMIPAMVLGRS